METCIEEELTPAEETALGRMQFNSNVTADHFGVERKSLTVKERSSYGGKCCKREIIIARSILNENTAIQIFIAVHEICHDVAGWRNSHNATFRRIEEEGLNLRGITRVIRPRLHIRWLEYSGEWYSWNAVMKRRMIIKR